MTEQETKSSGFRWPRWTLIWTVLAVAILIGLSMSTDWLSDVKNIQPGIINLLKLLTVFLTVIAWFIWLAFFSGHRLRFLFTLLAMLAVVGFFYSFRLVLDGDLGFVRVESRFASRTFAKASSAETGATTQLTNDPNKDFTQFLGNDRDGVVKGRSLLGDWENNPPKIHWRKAIGEGWSGFAAVNGFAITQEQRGQDECVTCYNIESGDLVWIYSADRRHEDTLAMGKVGPRATPTIDAGKVYTQGATGILDCIDGKDGSLLWSANIVDMLGTDMETKTSSQGFEYQFEANLLWGRSGSPLIYNDLVIATGGAQSDGKFSTLVALQKSTGEEVWRGGSQMIAYGSPAVEKLLGREQITIVAESAAIGLDPENGETLWQVERPGNSSQDANCSQVTKIADNRILLSKGYGLGGELVELNESDDGIKTKTIWKNARVLKTKMMSPVVLGDFVYALTDGFLECSSLEKDEEQGRRMWRKRGRFGNGQLLLVGQHLLVHTEHGVLKLIEATPERYHELGEIETIDGICWNTLCLYDNYLLVRSELEAACIELPMKSMLETSASEVNADNEVDGSISAEPDSLEPDDQSENGSSGNE